MTTTATATTLRKTARELVVSQLFEAAKLEHGQTYHKLCVWRNGTVSWSQFINKSDDLIDAACEQGLAAVPSVVCVGTGSLSCDCDYCEAIYNVDDEARAIEDGFEYKREEKYKDDDEAASSAASENDLSDLEESMRAEFDAIPIGYFSDED